MKTKRASFHIATRRPRHPLAEEHYSPSLPIDRSLCITRSFTTRRIPRYGVLSSPFNSFSRYLYECLCSFLLKTVMRDIRLYL